MCRPLLPVISRLQASQEVEGKRLECRVPKADLLPEFLLGPPSQEAVQGSDARHEYGDVDHARSFDLLQSPAVAPAWPEHFCDRGSEDRRAMVWLWAGAPSVVRAEVGAFKTVLNVRIVPNSPGQQPKKVANNSQNVRRRLPAKPCSISSVAPNDSQQGLFEGR